MAEVGPFGCAQDPEIVPCAVCGDSVPHVEKFMVEKEIVHKTCFICAYCDARLQVGYCVQELALYNRYGPCWYCSLICAHRPLAEKEAKLKEKGVEVRTPSSRRPKQSAGINVCPAGSAPAAAPAVAPSPAEVPAQEAAPGNVPEGTGEAEAVTEQEGVENVPKVAEAGDGPEMEAEELEMEAEEVPKASAEVGAKQEEEAEAEALPSPPPAEVAANDDGADGPEMEAEEVVKAPQEAASEMPEQPVEGGNESMNGAATGQEAESAPGDSAPAEAAVPATPTTPKEAKPVAMDAYENKYRLQMKKKK